MKTIAALGMTGLLAASTCAMAQEPELAAPWTKMAGGKAAAGTCSTDEASEVPTCYIVRCEDERLVFVVREADIGDLDPRRIRLKIGPYSTVLTLTDGGKDERIAPLDPSLLEALKTGETSVDLTAVEAAVDYSTAFDLTGAKSGIEAVEAACRKSLN
ncbi:hypothetical protein [Pararhizobium sp.]|uniref:hypothetical protein n=1 Tax=Pararhizobium sp. TaxID=1977563 RepID=UPI0027248210|nr:hypothetical protein [Pararhizobium sp.]MDO9416952.1 hypothetical protein [Pararhizobium sp.]